MFLSVFTCFGSMIILEDFIFFSKFADFHINLLKEQFLILLYGVWILVSNLKLISTITCSIFLKYQVTVISFQKHVFLLDFPISRATFVAASISTKTTWYNTSAVNVEWSLNFLVNCVLTEPSKRATSRRIMAIGTRTTFYNLRQLV